MSFNRRPRGLREAIADRQLREEFDKGTLTYRQAQAHNVEMIIHSLRECARDLAGSAQCFGNALWWARAFGRASSIYFRHLCGRFWLNIPAIRLSKGGNSCLESDAKKPGDVKD